MMFVINVEEIIIICYSVRSRCILLLFYFLFSFCFVLISLKCAGLIAELWCIGHSPPEVKVNTVPRALVVKCGQNIGIEIPYKGLYRVSSFSTTEICSIVCNCNDDIFLIPLRNDPSVLHRPDKCRPLGARYG